MPKTSIALVHSGNAAVQTVNSVPATPKEVPFPVFHAHDLCLWSSLFCEFSSKFHGEGRVCGKKTFVKQLLSNWSLGLH